MGLFALGLAIPIWKRDQFSRVEFSFFTLWDRPGTGAMWRLGFFLVLGLPFLRLYHFANPPADSIIQSALGFVAQLSSLCLGLIIHALYLQGEPIILAGTSVVLLGTAFLILKQRKQTGALPAAFYAIALTCLILGNATLDLNPNLFIAQCLLTAATSLCASSMARRSSLPRIAFFLSIFALVLWELTGHSLGFGTTLGACGYTVVCWMVLAGDRIKHRYREITWILAAMAATQILTATAPWVAGPWGSPAKLSTSAAYGYCTDPQTSLTWITFPRCSAFPTRLDPFRAHESCSLGTVEAFDLNFSRTEKTHTVSPFDPENYGRLEQPICLPEQLVVGMTDVVAGPEKRTGSTLTLSTASGNVEYRHGFNATVGHTLGKSPISSWVYAVDEFAGDMKRLNFRTRQTETFGAALTHPSLTLDGDPFCESRQSVLVAEHYFGDEILELRLEDGSVKSRYVHHNGGAWGVTVDEHKARVYVTGMWTLDVFDLRTGEHIKRHRTGFGARAVTIDRLKNELLLPCTLSGYIRRFDRKSLEQKPALPVGLGIRNLHITPATHRLVGSTTQGTFVWEVQREP